LYERLPLIHKDSRVHGQTEYVPASPPPPLARPAHQDVVPGHEKSA